MKINLFSIAKPFPSRKNALLSSKLVKKRLKKNPPQSPFFKGGSGCCSTSTSKYSFILFIFLFCCLLTSCTPLSIATTGIQAACDHHNLKKKLSDSCITMKAYNKLYRETNKYQDANISVAVLNQEVLLTGEVISAQQKKEVENLIATIQGIKKIYNQISISPPSSTLVRVSDSWITTKVKSKLLAMQDVDTSRIKVVTENGIVYLMGTVLDEEAEAATEAARTTDGVQKIVKIFSYLKICKE